MSNKKLTRNTTDQVVAGVASGLAEYFGIDKTLVRLAFVGLTLFGFGSAVVAYLVLWLLLPVSGHEEISPREAVEANVQEMMDKTREVGDKIRQKVS